jgi:alpha-tubulin suppressor-like RCC1 family protein
MNSTLPPGFGSGMWRRLQVLLMAFVAVMAACGGGAGSITKPVDPVSAVSAAVDIANASGTLVKLDLATCLSTGFSTSGGVFAGGLFGSLTTDQLNRIGITSAAINDAWQIRFDGLSVKELSRSGDSAQVHVDVKITTTIDPVKLRELAKKYAATTGVVPDDATIDAAISARLGGQFAQSATISRDIKVTQTVGGWVACGSEFAAPGAGGGSVSNSAGSLATDNPYATNNAYSTPIATALPEPSPTGTPEPTPTPAPLAATAIGVGANFACAVVAGGGSVVCWGGNTSGQLGNGTNATALRPVLVSGVTDAAAIAVDANVDTLRACVLHAAGTVSCWGDARSGDLGNNPPPALTPVAVAGISDGTALSVGGAHACVLHATGTVSCWGYNSSGELGDGTTETSMTPVAALGISDAIAIAAGQAHSCALRADGTVACWGYNLASGNAGGANPALVPGIAGATAISAGAAFTCALRPDTSVWCWGNNERGQMGTAVTGPYSKAPVQVAGVTGAKAISAGQSFVCAVRSDARVLCWGDNYDGVLGDGTNELFSAIPVMPVGLTDIKAVSGGNYEACSLGTSGGVMCWGAGALGDGTQNASRVPVTVWGP